MVYFLDGVEANTWSLGQTEAPPVLVGISANIHAKVAVMRVRASSVTSSGMLSMPPETMLPAGPLAKQGKMTGVPEIAGAQKISCFTFSFSQSFPSCPKHQSVTCAPMECATILT